MEGAGDVLRHAPADVRAEVGATPEEKIVAELLRMFLERSRRR